MGMMETVVAQMAEASPTLADAEPRERAKNKNGRW